MVIVISNETVGVGPADKRFIKTGAFSEPGSVHVEWSFEAGHGGGSSQHIIIIL